MCGPSSQDTPVGVGRMLEHVQPRVGVADHRRDFAREIRVLDSRRDADGLRREVGEVLTCERLMVERLDLFEPRLVADLVRECEQTPDDRDRAFPLVVGQQLIGQEQRQLGLFAAHDHLFEFEERTLLFAERERRARPCFERALPPLGRQPAEESTPRLDARRSGLEQSTEIEVGLGQENVRDTAPRVVLGVNLEPLERLHRQLRTLRAERAVAEQEVVVAILTIREFVEVGRLAQREHRLVDALRLPEQQLRLADEQPDVEHVHRIDEADDARAELGATPVRSLPRELLVGLDLGLTEQRAAEQDRRPGDLGSRGHALQQLASPLLRALEMRALHRAVDVTATDVEVTRGDLEHRRRDVIVRPRVEDLREEADRGLQVAAVEQQLPEVHPNHDRLARDERVVAQFIAQERAIPLPRHHAQPLPTGLGRRVGHANDVHHGPRARDGLGVIEDDVRGTGNRDELRHHPRILIHQVEVDEAPRQLVLERWTLDDEVPVERRGQPAQRVEAVDLPPVGLHELPRGLIRRLLDLANAEQLVSRLVLRQQDRRDEGHDRENDHPPHRSLPLPSRWRCNSSSVRRSSARREASAAALASSR